MAYASQASTAVTSSPATNAQTPVAVSAQPPNSNGTPASGTAQAGSNAQFPVYLTGGPGKVLVYGAMALVVLALVIYVAKNA